MSNIFKLTTQALSDGKILQELTQSIVDGQTEVLSRWIMDTRDEGIRSALCDLGWIDVIGDDGSRTTEFGGVEYEAMRQRALSAERLHTSVAGRVTELETAILEVVTEKGDDLCWYDVFTKLAALVGIVFTPEMLGREHMLANCARFVDSLLAGSSYVPCDPGAEVLLLEEIIREMTIGILGKADGEWWADAQRAAWRYANEFEPRFRNKTVHPRTEELQREV